MEYVNAAKEALRLGHRGYRYLTRNKRSNSSRVIKIHTEFMLSVTLSSGAASLSLSEATALSVDRVPCAELDDGSLPFLLLCTLCSGWYIYLR